MAVDAYLKTFDKLLFLRYYKMPLSAIIRVLGHGRKLIEEHLALAEKHFPTEKDGITKILWNITSSFADQV